MRERFSTKIIVRRLSPIKTGTTGDGSPYTISQVIATKPDGAPIADFNLRTFDALPTDCVIEVDCELFKSERFGDSYTVKLKAGQVPQQATADQGITKTVADLKTRVDRIEDFLSGRGEFAGSAAEPAGPPSPPPSGDAPPPPPPEMPLTDAQVSGEADIPF